MARYLVDAPFHPLAVEVGGHIAESIADATGEDVLLTARGLPIARVSAESSGDRASSRSFGSSGKYASAWEALEKRRAAAKNN